MNFRQFYKRAQLLRNVKSAEYQELRRRVLLLLSKYIYPRRKSAIRQCNETPNPQRTFMHAFEQRYQLPVNYVANDPTFLYIVNAIFVSHRKKQTTDVSHLLKERATQ